MSKHVAYLANFQGEDLVFKRNLLRNRALAASQKIATLARLIADSNIHIQVFSLGAAAERSWRYFSRFTGALPGSPSVPVHYEADWDIPFLGRMIGAIGLISSLIREHLTNHIDVLLVYNCGLPETLAGYTLFVLAGVPVVLEYEDNVGTGPDGRRGWRQLCHQLGFFIIRRAVKGIVAVSPELLTQLNLKNAYILRGVLDEDLRRIAAARRYEGGGFRYVFAGSLQVAKGIDTLCRAWVGANIPEAELHIVGEGPLQTALVKEFRENSTIHFHGFVSRSKLIDVFASAHVLVNPHVVANETGGIFPFKLIEYIGAGRPVISTPMAPLPPRLASGVLYSASDSCEDLAHALVVMRETHSDWVTRARDSKTIAWETYGPGAVKSALLSILDRAIDSNRKIDDHDGK